MKIKMSIIVALAITSLSATQAFINPLPNNMKAINNGGTLHAIDAYKDGVGVVIVDNLMTTDNSVMNSLVYKYGDAAKTAGVTVVDQVLYGTGTETDKVLAVKLTVNGATCNDNNPGTTGETWLSGVCQGGVNNNGTSCDDGNDQTINDIYTNGVCAGNVSTASVVDIFGDGSAQSLYTFDNTIGSGTQTNTSYSYIPGKFGQAISFVNSGINTGSSTLLPANSSYSFSTWIYKSSSALHYIVSRTNSATPYGDMFFIAADNRFWSTLAYTYATQGYFITNPLPIIDSKWHNIIATVNRTTKVTKLYLDGQLQAWGPSTRSQYSGDGPAHVPAVSSAGTNNVKISGFASGQTGILDHTRFFNKELSQSEVTQLFNEQ